MRHILKCVKCGKYNMEEVCNCGGKAVSIKPAKFSLEDNYGSYRREAKKGILQKEGLI
jgi:H/ACA ribonucleoprotein complex subunit 3